MAIVHEDGSVTLTEKEYEYLANRDEKLSALEAGGVDNWEWYSESLSEYWKEREDE